MSGYPYGGNPPQYPPPQNQMYPQISNPANAPPPGQASQLTSGFPMPGQYPTQPGFGFQFGGQTGYPSQHQQYPGQPTPQGYPGQGQPTQQPYPGLATARSYQGQPSAPIYPSQQYPGQQGAQGYPGQQSHPASMAYPGITPTQTVPTSSPYTTAFTSHPEAPALEWIPSSLHHASALEDKAVVAGYESHDGSPLWIIRTWFENDLLPGKLSIKHRTAYVPWGGKENAIENFEVGCARPDKIRWVESRDGVVPPKAIVAGNTSSREPLYIGRARHQGSLTPGKVHPSHKVLYISFGGHEVPIKQFEVLCSV